MGSQGGCPWDPRVGTWGPGPLGTHWPLGTLWPLRTGALGDPALGAWAHGPRDKVLGVPPREPTLVHR